MSSREVPSYEPCRKTIKRIGTLSLSYGLDREPSFPSLLLQALHVHGVSHLTSLPTAKQHLVADALERTIDANYALDKEMRSDGTEPETVLDVLAAAIKFAGGFTREYSTIFAVQTKSLLEARGYQITRSIGEPESKLIKTEGPSEKQESGATFSCSAGGGGGVSAPKPTSAGGGGWAGPAVVKVGATA